MKTETIQQKMHRIAEQLTGEDTRSYLRQTLAPLVIEHNEKHLDPFQHPECPFCTGDIT